jgi:single-stranded-DNA-specific exonuclease
VSQTVAKTWRLLPHDPAAVERLASALRTSPVVAQLLLNRGVTAPEAAHRFLEAPLSGLHEPEMLPGVEEAAGRIWAAVEAGRRICVYGDYDADGITGTAILLTGLRLLGAAVDFYVPNRLEEGYGLNHDALRQLAADGVSLVVTVDCGIASVAEAAEARRLGLDLIVTDHHEAKEVLPEALLVHPRLPGTAYPFGWLSGSAVAFKLAWALVRKASGGPRATPRLRQYLLDSVGLAALGVVADVVPLQDENRILVRHGLARLRQSELPGLQALCTASGLQRGHTLRASDVGFRLAPRLNAVGRLGCARLVVELLTTADPDKALMLARYLQEQNDQRQTLERRIVAEARELVEVSGWQNDPALVVAGTGWHGGVIGIVAGRLAETYARPTLMIALPDPTRVRTNGEPLTAPGSGRSAGGFPLHRALHACTDLLLGHGGHQAAAGFRILPENVDTFRRRFCAVAAEYFPEGPPTPTLVLDAEVPLSALTPGLLRELDKLEPYGADNRKPLFLAGGLEIVGEPRKVGAGEHHLSFKVRQRGTALKAIAFGMADRVEELTSAGGRCCLVFTPKPNQWQGLTSIDLEVADLQPGAEARLG